MSFLFLFGINYQKKKKINIKLYLVSPKKKLIFVKLLLSVIYTPYIQVMMIYASLKTPVNSTPAYKKVGKRSCTVLEPPHLPLQHSRNKSMRDNGDNK